MIPPELQAWEPDLCCLYVGSNEAQDTIANVNGIPAHDLMQMMFHLLSPIPTRNDSTLSCHKWKKQRSGAKQKQNNKWTKARKYSPSHAQSSTILLRPRAYHPPDHIPLQSGAPLRCWRKG